MAEFLHKFKKSNQQTITFQAPTGSGKTVMMAQFVHELATTPHLTDANLAFLWVSIGGSTDDDLTAQSKDKFVSYYDGASVVSPSDLTSLSRDKFLEENEILFFNWAKIKTSTSVGRKLRREGETEVTWDGMIARTKAQERNIVLIMDEAHREADSKLAKEIVDDIAPKIIIRITATHKEDAANIDVDVRRDDVVNEGLIKASIKTQTREEFKAKGNEDLDRYVLQLALNKREELKQLYVKQGIKVNPLLIVQLPNDESQSQEQESQKDIVLGYLAAKGVHKNKIAVWLSGEKKNLENITLNESETDVLLFKYAPSVGWDCPRAQVLLMYRESKNPTFQVQLFGRVLRMPEGQKYADEALNHSYLYTTFDKSQIIESYQGQGGSGNQAEIFYASIKAGIKPLQVETFISQKIEAVGLGMSFQKFFIDTIAGEIKNKKQLEDRKFFNTTNLNLNLIAGEKIIYIDAFIKDLQKRMDLSMPMSYYDVVKLYKKLCIEVLLRQEEEGKFGDIARSWDLLMASLNVFFEDKIKVGNTEKIYRGVTNDLLQGANSMLLPIINKALVAYKPIREAELREQEQRITPEPETATIAIPRARVGYSAKHKELIVSKCAMDTCYVLDNQNERSFIEFLEGNEHVVWWYKNGDNGSENFSVKREDERLFFPDWFIKTKKGVWVVDTKSGFTAQPDEVAIRARALHRWLADNPKYNGGITKSVAGVWQIATAPTFKSWQPLDLSS